jgi:hypothetical protein
MPTIRIQGIDGNQNRLSYSGGDIWANIAAPQGRPIWDGSRPIIIVGLALYMAGYGGNRTARVYVANTDGSVRSESQWFTAYGSNLADGFYGYSVEWGHNNSYGQLGVRVGMLAQSGLLRYGWNGLGGSQVHQGGSVLQNNATLAGNLEYIQAPTEPRPNDPGQISPAEAVVSWQWPVDDGGSPVTGYLIQYADNPQFNGYGQLTTNGNTFSARIKNLHPGTWYFRFLATNRVTAMAGKASAVSVVKQLTLVAPPGEPGDTDSWQRFGVLPAGMQDQTNTGLRRIELTVAEGDVRQAIAKENYVITGNPIMPADQHGAKRVVSGLTVGKVYRVRARGMYVGNLAGPSLYQLGVVGVGWGEPVDFLPANTPYSFDSFEWIATATSHEIAFRLAQNAQRAGYAKMEDFAIFDVALEEMPSGSRYRLQNTVYESSLLNHFDLANNSVGARWWVDRFGVTQFSADLGEGLVVATFSDERGAGLLEYVDIDTALDTRDIVNDLDLTNMGAVLGEDGWESDEETRTYQNLTSIATYGPRRETVETNLYDDDAYAGSIDLRANAIVGDDGTLQRKVTRIRWNAQEDPATAGALEVYASVNVWRRGVLYPCRIAAIQHDLTPTRWMITLDLIER